MSRLRSFDLTEEEVMTQSNGNTYDTHNFAGVMRECFILLMNRIPEDKMTRDKAFFKANKELAPVRKAVEGFYQWQVDKCKLDSLPVCLFGMVALNELEAGTPLSKIKQMFGFATAKHIEATMDNARLYQEMGED